MEGGERPGVRQQTGMMGSRPTAISKLEGTPYRNPPSHMPKEICSRLVRVGEGIYDYELGSRIKERDMKTGMEGT